MIHPDTDEGRISIAVYRPKPGREAELLRVVAGHLPLLRAEGLATAREAIVMQAADGTILEVFEWVSAAAIDEAHHNPLVMAHWERLGEASDHLPLKDLAEAVSLFAGFRPLPAGAT
ncbi:MAG: hypothetical protein Q8O14_07570 [bacterium]|jgi:hypothetical protein|nr:hypothetical protein [bacterium]